MSKRIRIYAFLLQLLIIVLSSQTAFCANPDEAWSNFINHGNEDMSEGDFENADKCFLFAIHLAEKNKLSPKQLAIALSGAASVEVLTGQTDKAEEHFQQLVKFDKQLRTDALSDRKLTSFLVGLADNYAGYKDPKTRESCLSHACYLKKLLFGEDGEYAKCLSELGSAEIKNDKLAQGIQDLTKAETVKAQSTGSNPNDALLSIFHQLAIDSRKAGKYQQAIELEKRVVALAKNGSSSFSAGLPAFYSFLGMNALEQGRSAEAKRYDALALQECSKIKTEQQRRMANLCMNVLVPLTLEANKSPNSHVAGIELKQMLTEIEAFSKDARDQYAILSLLPLAMHPAPKTCKKETDSYTERAIAIAELPNSTVGKDIPDLYMRWGIGQAMDDGQMVKAAQSFDKALRAESDKTGFHSTLVLLWWGITFNKPGWYPTASQKLNMAISNARILSPEKRGTLLTDALACLGLLQRNIGDVQLAHLLGKESWEELVAQQKLNSGLGPDIYKRLKVH